MLSDNYKFCYLFIAMTPKLTYRYGAPVCPCPQAGGDRQASGILVCHRAEQSGEAICYTFAFILFIFLLFCWLYICKMQ